MKLAINGGKPVRDPRKLFPKHAVIGSEERRAADRVIKSGALSKFIGSWDPHFLGGPEVRAFEAEWAKRFGAKYAVSMNSASSGLIAAVGALGIEPGDEVIVTPYSMCISATAPLWYGAVPVFADIEPDYFCLDPRSVEKAITKRTKAVIVVDILGQAYDADALNKIAKKHGIKVIEDAAQAPGALYKGRQAGTLADIGVYSLNFHKHIHTGEGTVVVTEDKKLAERLQLIRNHAEAAVEGMGVKNITNLIGQNFRLTEIQAAIGRSQLKKFDRLLKERQKNCAYINRQCSDMPGITPAPTRPGSTHVYYQHPFLYDAKTVGVPRSRFIAAVAKELPATEGQEAEGPLIYNGCVPPLYRMPLFRQKRAIGSKGFPFKSEFYKGKAVYRSGMCPVDEKLWSSTFFSHDNMRPGMTKKDLDDVIDAFHKVYEYRNEIR